MTAATQLTIGPAPAPRVRQPRRKRPQPRIVLDDIGTDALANGTLRIVAIDQGSVDCGVVYFEGNRPRWTKLFSPSESWTWQRRMRWITDELRAWLGEGEAPHVIAIEGVAFGVNASTALTMGEQRGWLRCALEYWYPGVRQMSLNPASVRGATGAGGMRRTSAKERYMRFATHVLGGARVSQDEADAVCIGVAAIARLRRDARLAGVEEVEIEGGEEGAMR